MLNYATIPLNSSVSFDFHPSQLLGNGYRNAKVLAILDADTAKQFIDPIAMHANLYPSLPPETPNAYDGYPYLKLKLVSGETTVVGLPWIKDETFEILTTQSMRITIDNVTPERQALVLQALSANGFGAVNVEYLNG